MAGVGLPASIYHVPGDYGRIQWAVDNASAGDTIYVHPGTYAENVVLDKAIYLIGADMPVIDAGYAGPAVSVEADACLVQGFHLTGTYESGVVTGARDCIIRDNVVDSGNKGIYLYAAKNCTVYNNTVSGAYYGICLEEADGNTIDNNSVHHNYMFGIYLISADGNTLRNNTCYGNGNIEVSGGIYLTSSAGNALYFNDLGDAVTAIDDYPGNTWYNVTLQRGNWYADYAGADGDGDGVGDTPYDIPGYVTQDLYPLMPVVPPVERAPVISNPGNSTPTSNSASVFWTTDRASDNVVLYGMDPGLAGAAWSAWDNATASPSIALAGLAPGTIYYYRCYAYNPDDLSLYSFSETLSFTTVRSPKTWTVDDDGEEMPVADFEKVQDAVNASIDGDSILVYIGLYEENVIVDRQLSIAGVPDDGDFPEIRGDMRNGSSVSLKASGCRLEGINVTRVPYFVYYRDHDSGLSLGYTDYQYYGGAWHSFDHASDDNVVLDCHFDNSGIYVVRQSDNNTIAGCSFAASIVTLQFAKDNRFTGCDFRAGSEVRMRTLVNIDSFPFLKDEPFNNTITGCSFADSEIDIGPYANDNNISYNTLAFDGLDDTIEGISVLSSGRTRLLNNTIDGAGHGTGIEVQGNDTYLSGNTVWSMGRGISIVSRVGTWVNTTMRDNNIGGCTYDFVLDPGTYGSYSHPWPANFHHDIDASNRVGGKRIYFIRNASDAIFDSSALPDAGFLALVDCRNVSVSGLSFEGNSHGLLLYNTSDSTLSYVAASLCCLDGIAIYDSKGVKVDGPTLAGNGPLTGAEAYSGGLLLAGCSDVTVDGGTIENNGRHGVRLDYSDGCRINNSTLLYNGYNDHYTYASGIYMNNAGGGAISGNNITALIPDRQRYGIYLDASTGNLICNNILSNPVNAREYLYYGGSNAWNVTKAPGANILGGPFLGGNAWSDYEGTDTDGDWLGDEGLPFDEYGNISSGGDHHPLLFVPDTAAPAIVIVSPEEGVEYEASYVYLDVFSPDADADTWWYSLNGSANVSFVPNTTVQNLTTGSHTLAVYASDTTGNVNVSLVHFSASVTGDDGGPPLEEVPDGEVDFAITLISPSAGEQEGRSVLLDYSAPVPLKKASYILDGSRPVKLWPMNATAISRLCLGEHSLIVNGEDDYGHKGKARFNFTVTPLLLYDAEEAGTPGFPDDAAYEFLGRHGNYTLGFEAWSEEGNVSVYINRALGGTPGDGPDIVDLYGQGALLAEVEPAGGWAAYELEVTGDVVAPQMLNLVSFIHEINPSENGSPREWRVRNVTLRPESAGYPSIDVIVDPQALSAGERRKVFLSVDGLAGDGNHSVYVYLAAPDGSKYYYPSWDETPVPLDDRYLAYSYYGRLPSVLAMDGFDPGTYSLVGQVVEEETGDTLAAGARNLYYNDSVAVKLHVNRELLSDGMTLRANCAVAGGSGGGNGSLVLSMKRPDGSIAYLPDMSTDIASIELSPLASSYERAYEGTIDTSWANGTYLLWAALYDGNGSMLSEDLTLFEVTRGEAALKGSFVLNESNPIVLSRIRLIDPATLETIEAEGNDTGLTGYSISAPAGEYFIAGELYDADGYMYVVQKQHVRLFGGIENRLNLSAKRMGRVFDWSGGMAGASAPQGGLMLSLEPLINGLIGGKALAQEAGACSTPQLYIWARIDKVPKTPPAVSAYRRLQEEFPNASYEEMVQYFEAFAKERIAATSPGIGVHTQTAVYGSIEEWQAYRAGHPGEDVPFQKPSVEYGFFIHIYSQGLGWRVYTELVDADTGKIIGVAPFEYSEYLEAEIARQVQDRGDLGPVLRDYEEVYKVPPRDPRLVVTVDPASVSIEPGHNRTAIKVQVYNCKGDLLSKHMGSRQEVYLQRHTSRGEVEGNSSGKIVAGGNGLEYHKLEQTVLSWTKDDGYAVGVYNLQKGSKAGEDTVRVVTFGRGKKMAELTATIRISGIEVDAEPDTKEIGPRESTLIRVRLYEVDAAGNQQPMAGKSIGLDGNIYTIQRSASLLGGTLTVEGLSDVYGDPVTDASGTATLRYTSVNKEGLAKIRFKYETATGETVEDMAQVRVKAERYLIKASWHSNGASSESRGWQIAGTKSYPELSNYMASWDGNSQYTRTMGNREDFASTTRYYLASGRESTTGRLNGMKQEDGTGSGAMTAMASNDNGWSSSYSGSGAGYNNKMLTYSASASEYPTEDAILHMNGTSKTYWVMLTPLPVAMDFSRSTEAARGVSWSEQRSSSGPGGSWSYSAGGTWSLSDSKTDTGRMSPSAMYNVPPDFFTLTKKVGDTYEFDYKYQNSRQSELVEDRSYSDEFSSVSCSVWERYQSDFVKVITIRMVKV